MLPQPFTESSEHSYSFEKEIISNKTLCEKCKESHLSRNIAESRWRLFGHFLYRNEKMQTNKAVQQRFITLEIDSEKNNYNPPSDHSVTIKRLVNSQDRFTPKIISIVLAYTKSTEDLNPIHSLTQDHDQWITVDHTNYYKIAEASRCEDQDAKSD